MTDSLSYPETKICPDKLCEQGRVEQSTDNFYKNDTTTDGLARYCKSCMRRRSASYRKAHPEKVREWHKTHIDRNKERNAERRRVAAAQDATRLVDTEE